MGGLRGRLECKCPSFLPLAISTSLLARAVRFALNLTGRLLCNAPLNLVTSSGTTDFIREYPTTGRTIFSLRTYSSVLHTPMSGEGGYSAGGEVFGTKHVKTRRSPSLIQLKRLCGQLFLVLLTPCSVLGGFKLRRANSLG